MAHSDILTESEYTKLVDGGLNHEVVRYLEYCRKKLGLLKNEINIIDWGCGRGIWVARLLELGYPNVKGVDISRETIERGRSFFARRGYDIDAYCSSLNSSGKCTLPDDCCHYLFSTQVLEHVSDLKLVASELKRITMPGGMGLHIFPAHHRPVEGHIFMPVVHWFPKNQTRKKLIRLWTFLGIEPRWKKLEGMPWQEKADVYYKFSIDNTFYRSYGQVVDIFNEKGIATKLVSIDHPVFSGDNARLDIHRSGLIKNLINWFVLNFKTVELLTTKHG